MKINNKTLFIISTIVVLLILAINIESIIALIRPGSEVWVHIRDNLLWEYTRNTVLVIFFSMLFSGIIGTVAAYFVSCFDFPFRKPLSVLLYLPLAIPPYVNAYVFTDILGPFGFFHNNFGIIVRTSPFWLAVMVFTLSLFPYVYIGVKAFLSHGMTSYIENARLMRKNDRQIFFTVILPIAKMAIFTGMILVGLEVMGDFAASHYLGVNTFSTAIFRSWIAFRDFDSALRLSGLAIVFVFSLLILKGLALRSQYRNATTAKSSQIRRKKLSGVNAVLPIAIPSLMVIASLAFPLHRLITWAIMSFRNVRYAEMASMIFNSIAISLLVTLIILIIALVIATYTRTSSKFAATLYGKTTLISYALPGAVVAMVTLFFFIRIDSWLGISLTTTIAMLIVGYTIRYLGIAYENISDGYKKLGKKHHEASRTLGKGYYKSILKVDIPMLKPFIISGMALVFIDLIKELPLTLVLRPFNFNTLATQVYQYASDEMLAESAVPSLIIIAISMVFIAIILRTKRSR
ncbi:MAG: iron ABC transporter permease [Defluviitaleaceae bacterium]|nr:iron ABC transporter permease [Defluviitaleaceae bacterium]